MYCPVDNEPMIVLEHDAVEIDYCVVCKGVWLDHGELELLLGFEEADAATVSGGAPAPAAGEKKRRCPVCGKKMVKEATPGDSPVTYDRCPRGHGVWFDDGELATVLKHGSAPNANERIAGFLREVFPEQTAKGE